MKNRSYLFPFILITSLFFLWGFANNLNGILIPHLRKALQLSNTQSTFVDTAVYLAYFLAAIPAGIIIRKYGYKRGILIGLLVFAAGALLFIPAANTLTYSVFLLGLFIIGCGLTVLETAANPYATRLGEPAGATARLNLAQSFNGLAAFIAPMLGTRFILSGKELLDTELAAMSEATRLAYFTQEAASVKGPYLILALFLLVLVGVFAFIKLPEFAEEDNAAARYSISDAWRNPQVRWAVIAQFFYVGAQVCVTSFFVRAAMTGGGVDEKTAGVFLGYYGLSFMVGRFIGAFLLRQFKSANLLAIYAVVCLVLSLLAVFAAGPYVLWALWGLGFFMSIMFPTIFSLGIDGLTSLTKPASSLIVMAIIGGAIFPVIMGQIIDAAGDNIQRGYLVPLACYVVVLIFALRNRQTQIQ